MKKSIWIALNVALVSAFALAACSPAATPTAAPQATSAPAATAAGAATSAPAATTAGTVTITVWHQWDTSYLPAIQKAFDAYSAAHPNVKFDLSKPNDTKNALSVAIPAGQGPDIVGWANDVIGDEALAGNIVDLGTLGVDKAFMAGIYEPAAVKGVVWKDKIWALPETEEAIALVYNKAILTDNKYLPSDPSNFDDLLAKATQYAKDFPGKFLVCNQGFGGSDAYHQAPVYFGFGVPSYVDDTGKVYLNTPEALKAGQWLAAFSKVAPTQNSDQIATADFADGTCAIRWTGPWAIAGIEKAGIKYGILSMGKPFVGIKTMMISKNAVDRGTATIALDVIKYYTSAEVQKQIALANKVIPAQTAALKDPTVAALTSVVGFGASANLGVPMANTPFAGAQWTPVGDASVAIWTGAQAPDAALKAAQTAIETAIAAMK